MSIYVGTSEIKNIYVGTTPVKEVYVGTTKVRPTGWQPGANTLGYYTMNNDILNNSNGVFPDGVLNNATFSTTKVHGNNTYSLYCDGSTYAYLPANSAFAFGANDFTISCWVYSETNSGTHTGIISNYNENFSIQANDIYWGWRISDRFSNSNKLNLCRVIANSGGTFVAWYDGATNTSIYNDGWHNIVVTRSNGSVKIYLDNQLLLTDTTYAGYNFGRNNKIAFGVNMADGFYSKCYINDVIFENKGWTEQEITDYYNLTK